MGLLFLFLLIFFILYKAYKDDKKTKLVQAQKQLEIELKERKKKQLEKELKEKKAKEEALRWEEEKLRKSKLEQEARKRFLDSKKVEVYYYTESMLVKFINENREDWKICFDYVPDKSYYASKTEVDVYDTKDFYIKDSFSGMTDYGSVKLINKINGVKTLVYIYGASLYEDFW